ncbi:MAG: LptE family protein [Candidatus Omnitrophica bacterium]|nr:LptE family protein [Candidatus Omnitrophota bacterium]
MKRYKAVIFLLMFVSGCGYTAGSLIPSHIKTIYVETFTNKTSEPNIELDITNAIKDRYAWASSLNIANDKENADSMLQGEIINFEKQPVAYGANNEIAEYRLILTVNLIYTDLNKNKIIWEEKKFKADSEYYTTMKEQKFSSTNLDKQALIENAAKELALEVVARTVEGW